MTEHSSQLPPRASANPGAMLLLPWLVGAVEALLLARVAARLLAARPDNPAVMILYGVTSPLVTPFRALDYDQPPFGAALEFSTLAAALCVLLGAYLVWAWLNARKPCLRHSKDRNAGFAGRAGPPCDPP